MKKLCVYVFVSMLMLFGLSGCGNKDIIDFNNNSFNKAIIKMPDDTVLEVKVNSWKDYDGEQIQIKGKDGKTYLVSSYNCILIKE